jgi:putative tricarboxylic transport membrane protein
LLPVLIGLFAITQVVADSGIGSSTATTSRDGPSDSEQDQSNILLSLGEYSRNAINLLRSSLIGVFVGILPGVGANIGSVVAYSAAKGMSKTPTKFGSGSEEGIIASEAANNATIGGALIPLIAMGIPGSVIDAILIGALTIHGLQPGPLLMQHSPDAVNVMMATILMANIFMFVFMLSTAPWLARLAHVPKGILAPAIVTFCVIGSYALANRMFDVWVMLGFGAIGLLMQKLRLPVAPFVIGFVLAPIAEVQIIEGLMQSGGSWLPLFTRPVAIVMLLFAASIMMISITSRLRKQPSSA